MGIGLYDRTSGRFLSTGSIAGGTSMRAARHRRAVRGMVTGAALVGGPGDERGSHPPGQRLHGPTRGQAHYAGCQ